MPELESKYSLNQKVQFSIRNVLFVGKVVGIVFIEQGVFYDIEDGDNIHRGVEEELVQKA